MQTMVWQSITVARYSQPSQVAQVGDVADELRARHVGSEVAADQVGDQPASPSTGSWAGTGGLTRK